MDGSKIRPILKQANNPALLLALEYVCTGRFNSFWRIKKQTYIKRRNDFRNLKRVGDVRADRVK